LSQAYTSHLLLWAVRFGCDDLCLQALLAAGARGRETRSLSENVEHDLAKVPAALLMVECGNNLFQREVAIYYWTQAIRFDRPHHFLLLAAAADQQSLQAQLPGKRQA
jgi:hypothetical protein